jgi:quercetin dioxygenase-like cupin family protein
MTAKEATDLVEIISKNSQELTYIIRASYRPDETNFLTPPELKQQVGYVVYSAGSEIPKHFHRALERKIVGTSEVLVVKSGRCLIDIYDEDQELIATREVSAGDVILLVNGGHGFRMLEDTVFLEIKQGPYVGLDEKERF